MADSTVVRELKLCLLGDSGVGKTCLVVRFLHDRFIPHPEVSLATSFTSKTIKTNGQSFNYHIWDTAGQERFKSMAPMYYRGCAAAIIVYDITSESSFESVKRWVTELRYNGPKGLVIAIAGNKTDLADGRRVSTITGQRYADDIGALFFECSPKTAENVKELFEGISQKLPPEAPSLQNHGFSQENILYNATQESVPKTNRKCCR